MSVGCSVADCPHEGMPCFLPDAGDAPSEYYCSTHAYEHGYCKGCGDFWGGVKSFEFLNGGYCDTCKSQLDADMRDEWDDEPDDRDDE